MTKTTSIARHLLTASLLTALAVPAFAQSVHPNKMIRHEMSHAKAAADAAAATAAAAAQEAAKQATAAEKLAADTRAGRMPSPKGMGDKFSPETVTPYVDNLRTILDDLKATTTKAQAKAYAPKFQSLLPSVDTNHKKAMDAYADAITSGVRTADNNAAEPLMSSASGMAAEIEQEMPRVQKLNPKMADHFQTFRDMHEHQ